MRKLVLLFSVISTTAFAQLDVPYNQYFYNQNMFNPAYAGVNDAMSLNFFARQQWVGLEGHPQSFMFNAHTSLVDNKVGLGLILQNDKYGVTQNNEVHLNYSYILELSDIKLSFGVQTGFIRYSNDYTMLNADFSDPSFPFITESFSEPNFGGGIFAMGDNYYFGVSVPKFINIEYNDGAVTTSRYKRHFYISGGYLFDQIFAFKIKPSFLYRLVDGTTSSLDINLSALPNERIWVGTTVTDFGRAFGVHAMMEFDKRYRAGFSGMVSGGTFAGGNFGTFEVMVSMDIEAFNKQATGNRYF